MLFVALGLLAISGGEPTIRQTSQVTAVVAELDRSASLSLWPGFDPRIVPLALWLGEHTFLVGHPTPPPECRPLPGQPRVCWLPGRPAGLSANSQAEIAGARTATVMLETMGSPREQAALAVHEAFHVFQWRAQALQANEGALFTYPLADAAALALRRQETIALRRALDEGDPDEAAEWAMAAMVSRRARFLKLPPDASGYEQALERHEGLAAYVQGRVANWTVDQDLPAEDYPLADVRPRAYASGRALALLLDRLRPDWVRDYDLASGPALDELALEVLLGAGIVPAETGEDERDRAWLDARREVASRAADLARRREAFQNRPGWRLEIVAEATPLSLAELDPMNVVNLGGGEVLHTRWVRLARDGGQIEVEGESLTTAAGTHPLFEGVRRLAVTGLKREPALRVKGQAVSLEEQGVRASFPNALVERSAARVTVRLR